MLKPALRRVWRDESTLQLGLTPAHAVIVGGLSAQERSVLALLDGSRDIDGLVEAATANGVDADVTSRMLDTLTSAQVLEDAAAARPALGEDDRQRLEPDLLSLSLRHEDPGAAARILRQRQQATVAVHGTARVGATVAMLLATSGIGSLSCIDRTPLRPADLAPGGIPTMRTATRGSSAATRIAALSKSVHVAVDHHAPVTLNVLAPAASGELPELLAGVRREPHLLAQVMETTGVVGPLVLPGHTPCLRCVALARGERDPLWPHLSAQLAGSGAVTEPCDVSLATLVGALATMQVLAYVDGDPRPASYGGIVEYDLGAGTLRRRSVRAHPACGCGADAGDLLLG
jgi:bacteriocin biosynthesis cyclodehydratase domain-containing protein